MSTTYAPGTDRTEVNRAKTQEHVIDRFPGIHTLGRYQQCGKVLGTPTADQCAATTQNKRTATQTSDDAAAFNNVSLNEQTKISCETCTQRTIHPKEYRESGSLLTTTANLRANGSNAQYHVDHRETIQYRDILRNVHDERKCSLGIDSGEYNNCSAVKRSNARGTVVAESLKRAKTLGGANFDKARDSPKTIAAAQDAYNKARGIE